jgi:uncharacterized membrane protein (DUF106 family)
MTPAERFTILILGISLVFTIMCTVLGLLVNVIRKWTLTEERLANLTQDVKTLSENSDRRITWLEQNLWRRR